MPQIAVWNGTEDESFDLLEALNHNCACGVGTGVMTGSSCGSHQLLASQRAMNGLLFARHIAKRLRREEFDQSALVLSPVSSVFAA